MKTLILATLLMSSSSYAALTVSDLKACAMMSEPKTALFQGALINGKDSGIRFKFDGQDVYKLTVPRGAATFSIPLKSQKGFCFSRDVEAPSRTTNSCGPAAGLEKLSGPDLNQAFTALMQDYSSKLGELVENAKENQATGDVGESMDSDDFSPEDQDSRFYLQNFKNCARLQPLSPESKKAYVAAQAKYNQLEALVKPLKPVKPASAKAPASSSQRRSSRSVK